MRRLLRYAIIPPSRDEDNQQFLEYIMSKTFSTNSCLKLSTYADSLKHTRQNKKTKAPRVSIPRRAKYRFKSTSSLIYCNYRNDRANNDLPSPPAPEKALSRQDHSGYPAPHPIFGAENGREARRA